MAVIVDTSVAVKWAVPESGWERAQSLLSQPVIAPDLLRGELAQALYKKVRDGELTAAESLLAQAEIEALLSFLPVLPMSPRALEISLELNHAAGDCFFLALAENIDLPIITADVKLIERCRGTPYSSLLQSL